MVHIIFNERTASPVDVIGVHQLPFCKYYENIMIKILQISLFPTMIWSIYILVAPVDSIWNIPMVCLTNHNLVTSQGFIDVYRCKR